MKKTDGKFTINGVEVKTCGVFAYDGCHKIYICEDLTDISMMTFYGYSFLPIYALPKVWRDSCPLKFILNARLDTEYVPQDQNNRRVYFGGFKNPYKDDRFPS